MIKIFDSHLKLLKKIHLDDEVLIMSSLLCIRWSLISLEGLWGEKLKVTKNLSTNSLLNEKN